MTSSFPTKMLYEFHLTTRPLAAEALPGFIDLCRAVGGKAVLIALPQGVHSQQPMLSFVCDEPSWAAAQARLTALAQTFTAAGFAIIREKAEIPADCAAEFHRAEAQQPAGYFEWHGKIRCSATDIPAYQALGEKHGARLSANTLQGQADKRFLTLRQRGSHAAFMEKVRALCDALPQPAHLLKQHYEYCVYDSRIALDDGWI